MAITCGYCDWWTNSPILSRGEKSKETVRRCVAKNKKITSDKECCRYYNPVYFYCDQNNQRLKFEQCLARRRNSANLATFQACKNCRQFDKEIRPIVEEYFLNGVPIVTPRHIVKIDNQNQIGSGKITRRIKPEHQEPQNKRKITRRDKPTNKKEPRKITRRSAPKSEITYTICPKCGQQGMKDNYCRICAFKPDMSPPITATNLVQKRQITRRDKKDIIERPKRVIKRRPK
jgi:hypothetical protein